jgi:hypothetical protein
MFILGLGCTAQVGKDTAAAYLEEKFPGKAKRVAFADKVKQVAMLLFGLSYEQCYGPVEIKEKTDPRYGLSPREILQGIGEKMREIYPSIWVDTIFNTTIPDLEKEGYDCFVISDVRYPNEADKIHSHGGVVVKIERNGSGASVGSSHSSETAMRNYEDLDYVIQNNSDLGDYYLKLDKLMEVSAYGNRKERGNIDGK